MNQNVPCWGLDCSPAKLLGAERKHLLTAEFLGCTAQQFCNAQQFVTELAWTEDGMYRLTN